MHTFTNICLGTAAFMYLVPLQLALRQPVQSGFSGLGTSLALLLSTLLLWGSILAAWCALLPQGGFAWIGGGRSWQFVAMFAGWLGLTVVTLLTVGLRGDPQLPTFLRPFMPWSIYVLPALALAATALLSNADVTRTALFTAGRFSLGLCGVGAFFAAAGIGVEYAVLRQRDIAQNQQKGVRREEAITALVREVESLDPERDLERLLFHTARDRFNEPRTLAVEKIRSHPNLPAALAEMLARENPRLALDYLDADTPPQLELLAGPVNQAIRNMARWIQTEIDRRETLDYTSFFEETDLVLQAATKIVGVPGANPRAAVVELGKALNCPKAKDAHVDAIRLVDEWLQNHSSQGPNPST